MKYIFHVFPTSYVNHFIYEAPYACPTPRGGTCEVQRPPSPTPPCTYCASFLNLTLSSSSETENDICTMYKQIGGWWQGGCYVQWISLYNKRWGGVSLGFFFESVSHRWITIQIEHNRLFKIYGCFVHNNS